MSSSITRNREDSTMLALMIDGILIRRDVAGRYSLNDMHRAAIKSGKASEIHAPGQFLRNDGAQRFIAAFDARQTDVQNSTSTSAKKIASVHSVKGGKNQGTYAAELVAIRYAAWIDADFEVGVYLTFQAATKSRDNWIRERAHLAAAHSVMSGMLHDTRAEAGKGTESHHYANESMLVNWAICGEFKKLDRDAMSAADLVLLAQLETRNAVLIGRGVSYDERKHELVRHAAASRLHRLAAQREATA